MRVSLFLLCFPLVAAPLLAGGTLDDVFRTGKRAASPQAETMLADDLTFLRRVHLDLAGVIPDRATVARFTSDERRDKRAREIERLLASEAFTERLTTFFNDLFMNHAMLEDSGAYRNAFHDMLREMVAKNTPYDEMARRIIAGTGRGDSREAAMFLWAKEAFEEKWRYDYLDDQTAWLSETMLGVQTRCISCHDGQYRLEEVNVGLSTMRRRDFWGMAAFLSSTYFQPREEEEDEADPWAFFRAIVLVDVDSPDFDITRGPVWQTIYYEDDEDNGMVWGLPDGEYLANTKPVE